MKKILGIVMIVIGLVLVVQGLNRGDSLVGEASEAGTELANAVDGGSRVPKHVGYIIAGGALAVVGAVVAFRGGRTGGAV
jgi:hypothetical protein